MMLFRKALSLSRLSCKVSIITHSTHLSYNFKAIGPSSLQYGANLSRCNTRLFATQATTGDSSNPNIVEKEKLDILEPGILPPPPQQNAPKVTDAEIEDEDDGIVVPEGTEEVARTPDGKEWEYYNEGEEKEKKEQTMYDVYLGEAKAGDIGAMHSVGKVKLDEGKPRMAIKWLEKAIDGGHKGALATIAHAYHALGEDDKALSYFRKAYKNGNENASWNLGTGVNGEKDFEEAFKWFMIAAERGNEDAMFNVGNFYLKGLGVEKDLIYAREWLVKAAIKGSEKAQKTAEELNMIPKRKR